MITAMKDTPIVSWMLHAPAVPGNFWLQINERENLLCVPFANRNDVVGGEPAERDTYIVIPKGTPVATDSRGVKHLPVEVPQLKRRLTEAEAKALTSTHHVYYTVGEFTKSN